MENMKKKHISESFYTIIWRFVNFWPNRISMDKLETVIFGNDYNEMTSKYDSPLEYTNKRLFITISNFTEFLILLTFEILGHPPVIIVFSYRLS